MKPVRSLLYVPANNSEWVASAPTKYEADAIIYDLEDAVPPEEKAHARNVLSEALPDAASEDTVFAVRVNPPDTTEFDADIDAIVREEVDVIVVPKLSTVENVDRIAHVIDYLETIRGLETPIQIALLPETAWGFTRTEELCEATDRVSALIGASSRGGDIERALGFEWTKGADERRFFLSKLLMEGRAAGLNQFIAGPWLDVADTDGLTAEAEMVKQYGYTGFQVVHPDHVPIVNNVFTPSVTEAEEARELLYAFDESDDDGVFQFDGQMVDIAHRKRAAQIVEQAKAFDVL
ncbi:HpcH/HpaI aldolase/citrate lyase family protein [Halosolutus amylolyticus]|uniref:HpcH/HpaI aldolase/citrate lyase family protein n=1 Tax=Halosolutus amylolyticus TaxID=2932267 RepID=A0ABD5PIR3_9EURY|nr:CoA ester lyase [Halosolutus amylolyticus]